LFTQIVWHRALLYLSGGSATELSATDAWAEPLPVIEVNVWTSLYVPWARNPAFLTTEAVTGSDMGDETHHHDRLRSPRCLDRTVVKSI